MNILILFFHTFLNYFLGSAALPFLTDRPIVGLERFCLAVLAGIFLETTLAFWFIWMIGGTIATFSIIILLITVAVNIPVILKSIKQLPNFNNLSILKKIKSIAWYEGLMILFLVEKVAFIAWQLLRMPTYQTDALKHWSAVPRAIYGGPNNWTLIAKTPEFLGRKMGFVPEYPMGIPLWRSLSATYNMGWNDFIARSDGLLLFVLLISLVYVAFKYFTKKRWMALGAAAIVASIPLQVWQGASGYVDNAVAVFVVATIWTFIRKDWMLSGLLAAGAIWCKNDGLAIFLPGFLAVAFFYNVFLKEITWGVKLKRIIHIGVGIVPIVPWLVFQALYSSSIFNRIVKPIQGLFSSIDVPDYQIVLVQTGKRFENSPGSLSLFWEYVFIGSSHGVFWLVALLAIILLSKQLIVDLLGRCLLLYILITSVIIYYVFTYTPAYEFLLIQTTIHRTMMQFAPVVLMIIGYGIFLYKKDKKELSSSSNKKVPIKVV